MCCHSDKPQCELQQHLLSLHTVRVLKAPPPYKHTDETKLLVPPRPLSLAALSSGLLTLRGAVIVQREHISSEISSRRQSPSWTRAAADIIAFFSPSSCRNSRSRLKKITAYCLFISVRKTLKVLYDICADIYIHPPPPPAPRPPHTHTVMIPAHNV